MPMRDGRPIEVAPKNEKGWVDIQEFISSGVCRRVVLDQVMDGRMDRERCEEGEEACDVCQGKDKEERRQAARERVISRLNEEIGDGGVVVDAADEGSSGVIVEDDSRSEVSVDQGFQHERRRIDVIEEMEFASHVSASTVLPQCLATSSRMSISRQDDAALSGAIMMCSEFRCRIIIGGDKWSSTKYHGATPY
ncbi:hypothetical protein ACEPPN_013199 [Leptodophora sp. 'Broadleaf-Isolate-01']